MRIVLRSVASRYLEHLTPGDTRFLAAAARAAGIATPDDAAGHVADASWILRAFGDESVRRAVLGTVGDPAVEVVLSPFAVFAAAVHDVAGDLAAASFTPEWVAPRTRVPVFDTPLVRELLDDQARRLFLAELLASYTRVAAWTEWVHTGRGWTRRRYSDLDAVALAELARTVAAAEQPGVWRRLGDLCLFLTGVFPDHSATRDLGPVREQRLRRLVVLDAGASARADGGDVALPGAFGAPGAVALYEAVGVQAYRRAVAGVPRPLSESMLVVDQIAERFRVARRVLNLVTDRHLFPLRDRWFNPG